VLYLLTLHACVYATLLFPQTKLSLTLKEYRLLHGAHVRNPGALIYPSTLRYMPSYLLGLVKSTAFRCAQAGLSVCLFGSPSLCACPSLCPSLWMSCRGTQPPQAAVMACLLLPLACLHHPHTHRVSSRNVVLTLLCCPCRCCCHCRGTGRDVAADERSAAAHSLMAAPVDDTLLLAYPDIYDVSQAEGTWGTEQGGKVGLLCSRTGHGPGA
jgi:hypothetical protein